MSFYRYALERLTEPYCRSMTPIDFDPNTCPFFSYRYYTSEMDDSPGWAVISIGRERRWPGKEDQGRTTPKYAIHYCVSGHGTFNDQPVCPGDFFVMLPFRHSVIKADADSHLEFYYLTIQGASAEELLREAIPDLGIRIYPCPFISKIPSIFNEALFKSHDECDPEFYFRSLMYRLLSMHKKVDADPNELGPSKKSYQYYKVALSYISQYLEDRLSPSDIASFLHISPSYLRRIFSQYCRYSIREYLIRVRLDHAANLLTHEDTPVTEISTIVGYPNYTTFSTLFKKYMGVSPREYRAQRDEKRLIELSQVQSKERLTPER